MTKNDPGKVSKKVSKKDAQMALLEVHKRVKKGSTHEPVKAPYFRHMSEKEADVQNRV